MTPKNNLLVILLAAGFAVSFPATAQPASPGAMQGQGIERLRQADTNHDGMISRAEFQAERTSQWQRFDRNGDGYFSQSDLPRFAQSRWNGEKLTELRRQFDANRDGRISRAEFIGGPSPIFDAADIDGNDLVSRAEQETIEAKLKNARLSR